MSKRIRYVPLLAVLVLVLPIHAQDKKNNFELKKGDRIAWVGSSSTNIGVWPKTMEFLLRTRHPELELTFKKFSTGGGTFATGAQNLDKWLADFKPTVVFLNYGGNDAGAGEKGLPTYKENMTNCVTKIEAAKARVLFTCFQGADVRKSGEEPAARRKLYAETQLAFCKEKGWPIFDVFHRTQHLQDAAQKDDDKYTMLRDKIHLTDPAYVAWGYYLYVGLGLKKVESELVLANGVIQGHGCKLIGGLPVPKIVDGKTVMQFTRQDHVLPILPPGVLPPRKHVPLERYSSYLLNVGNLAPGNYAIECEGKRLGVATALELRKGINVNKLILDNNVTPPWNALAQNIWAGKDLDKIGKAQWKWRVVEQ